MAQLQRLFPTAYGRFLRSWLNDPLAVGAVAPSGRPLARCIAREIRSGDRVVELGPGTGTVTREILARGVRPQDLSVIERCPGFADLLESEYRGVTVLRGDATEPQAALASLHGSVDFVVSGLPLVLFSREQKDRLLAECFRLLGERGAMIQFTYGGRCPVGRRDLERQGLVARCVGFVAFNMPPAFIYRIARAGAPA
jgi:phosphatidylethanolamine/phosphatidyl-N-methylethanolamine N-methyltransferase